MPLIYWRQKPAAEHLWEFFSWDGCQNTANLSIKWGLHVSTTMLQFLVVTAAEAELGDLYYNCQTVNIFRLTLTNMGHPQPKTPVHCNNATAVGIANNTIKHQHLWSIEMRFFWIGDKISQEMYVLKWHPGQEYMDDYQSNQHMGLHHVAVWLWYLHMQDSAQALPWAKRPSALKGCVGTLKDST